MLEIPREGSLGELVRLEDRTRKNLDVMLQTVSQGGENLFQNRLERAGELSGPDRTAEIISVGLQREMVCGVYQDIRIPHLESHLEQLRMDLQEEAARQAETLNELLAKGYIDKSAFDAGIEGIANYLESKQVSALMRSETDGNEDNNQRSELFRQLLSQVKFRGRTGELAFELTKAVSPETMYPTQALQLAVFPKGNERGERPKLTSYIHSVNHSIEPVGLTVKTVRKAMRSGYYMDYADAEMAGVSRGESAEQSFVDRIKLDAFTDVHARFVVEVVGALTKEGAKSRKEILKGMYPEEEISDKHIARLNMVLPVVRDILKQWGIYVHVAKNDNGDPGYYVSETPRKERSDKHRNHNVTVVNRRRSKTITKSQRVAEPSEKEASRQLIEGRVRDVTMGAVGQDIFTD